MEVRNIRDHEAEIRERFAEELKPFHEFANRLFDLIQDITNIFQGRLMADIPTKDRICVLLAARLANDLVISMRLAAIGYSNQAAMVAGSGWELGWVLAWITIIEDAKAETWYQHKNPKNSFHGQIRQTIEKVINTHYASEPEDGRKNVIEQHLEVHSEFGMIRHGNPIRLSMQASSHNSVAPQIGPMGDEFGLLLTKHVLHHLYERSFHALTAWFNLHADDQEFAAVTFTLQKMMMDWVAFEKAEMQKHAASPSDQTEKVSDADDQRP
ncbi:hypothetical protein ACFSM5_11305 [Lacibacterium aquatile]|uniref:Uncharacterized protein n=1 Tax=Lacibacterium aquatile TaxID=1168082 RepID=A0ABW5DR00_9PROT